MAINGRFVHVFDNSSYAANERRVEARLSYQGFHVYAFIP